MTDNIDEAWKSLGLLQIDPPETRDVCKKCSRPLSVCLCQYLPREPIDVETNIVIIQHPHEETRPLRTEPLLKACLPIDKVYTFKRRRLTAESLRSQHLDKIVSDPNTLLLFPGTNAIDINQFQKEEKEMMKSYNLILIDGTWSQSREIFRSNELLQNMRQVKLCCQTSKSEYVIRKQPNDAAMSTLEAAAYALSILENNPTIIEILLKPLRALCGYQLQCGAVIHQSKEHFKKIEKNKQDGDLKK